jgi:hyperosmotically inducible periplasmic protein
MKHPLRTTVLTTLLAVTASAALVACDKPEATTPGQHLDAAIADVKSAAQQAEGDARAATQDVTSAAKDGAQALSDAAGDAAITAKIKAALAADDKLSALKVDVDTVQGKVTLSGTAPDALSKERAQTLAEAVQGVSEVTNHLVVAG